MRKRFHRHRSYSRLLPAGAAICVGMSGCQFGKALEAHDPTIMPQDDAPLETSKVAAIRALPPVICGLRGSDDQIAIFAVQVTLPGADPGQPLYVMSRTSIDCGGHACSVVSRVRAMPEGAAWRNAEMTVRRCASVDAATSCFAAPNGGPDEAASPSAHRFVWRGDAWIAR